MHPSTAAKRTIYPLVALLLLVTASVAVADDDESQGYLGVMLQDLTSSMSKALQLDSETGIMVSEVVEDGPAEKAGLEDGDVILKFDGEDIVDYKALTKAVRARKSGDEVEVVVLREGETKRFDVTLGEREDMEFAFIAPGGEFKGLKSLKGLEGLKHLEGLEHLKHLQWLDDDDHELHITRDGDEVNVFVSGMDLDRGFLGVHLDDLSEQLGNYFEIEDGDGALITEVVADSPAEKAGLQAGDVIVNIGDEEIESSDDVHEFMAETEPDQTVIVEVVRKGQTKEFGVTCGELPDDAITKHMQFIGDDDDVFTFHGGDDNVFMHKAPHAVRRILKHMDEPALHDILADVHEGDLDQVKEELNELKEELKELREELKK